MKTQLLAAMGLLAVLGAANQAHAQAMQQEGAPAGSSSMQTSMQPTSPRKSWVINTLADLRRNKKIRAQDTLLINPDIGSERIHLTSDDAGYDELKKALAGKTFAGIEHVPEYGYFYRYDSAAADAPHNEKSINSQFINSKLQRAMAGSLGKLSVSTSD